MIRTLQLRYHFHQYCYRKWYVILDDHLINKSSSFFQKWYQEFTNSLNESIDSIILLLLIMLCCCTQVNEVRQETVGLQRKILGSWKQYSGREFPGFFPVDSDNFPWFPRGSSWKSSENSGWEYCFHVPDISRVFLQDPVTFPHLSCEIRWQE